MTVTFTVIDDNDTPINLNYRVFKNTHSKLWLEGLIDYCNSGQVLTDTDRLYNFNPTIDSYLKAINECNYIIKKINDNSKNKPIPFVKFENLQNDVNHIHINFVDSDLGLEYTKTIDQKTWADLNAYLHGLEIAARNKDKRIPQGQIFVELENKKYFDLPEESYQYFTIKKTFGYCYANYPHIGRHLYELYLANDTNALNEHIIPQSRISGSSYMWFGNTTPDEFEKKKLDDIKEWFVNNQMSTKVNLEWGDPRLAIGWLPVAELKNNITAEDLRNIKKIVSVSVT
jgi:hypothetical protein